MTIIVAHRGASRQAHENTLESFLAAVEMGADMVELDIRRTADGKLVPFHDPSISRYGRGPLVQDLTLSSLLVVAAVGLALLVFFRWWPCVLALLLPLGLATVYAFALASLLGVRVLNSNTAFLGSIIVGNGINFGIVQLARYMEERRAGQTVQASLMRSLWGTRVGTLSAALAAAVSYASLIAMQFRGFRQFGVIGGLGMVLAWGTTFLLGPPLIAWMDRQEPHVEPTALRFLSRFRPMSRLARLVVRYPRTIVVLAIACSLIAIVEVRGFGGKQLEYDLARMRRADTWKNGEGYWGHKMDTLLGQYLTPLVMLTNSPEETKAVARELRKAMLSPPLNDMVAQVRTLDDLLPPDQAERQREIERIRKKLTANVRKNLTDEQRKLVDRFLGQESVPAIEAGAIPATLLKGLQDRDGHADRAVLIFPKLTAGLWDGPRITVFVQALRTIARGPEAMGGKPARLAGGPPLTADIIASMRHDGPLASLLAFFGVVLTVVLLFRALRTVWPAPAAALGLISLPLLAASLQLLISTTCRAVKEAQTYLSLSVFLPMGAGMFVVFAPPSAHGWCGLLPLAGQQLQLEAFMAGSGTPTVQALAVGCLTAALAAACFVKAFAIPFLALPRSEEAAEAREAPAEMRAGMGMLAVGCVVLGLGAAWFVRVFDSITEQTLGIRSSAALVTARGFALSPGTPHGGTISPFGIALLFLIAGVAFAWPLALRWKRRSVRGPAWDCGLPGLTADNEYTATAFSKPLRMIFSALYRPRREIQAEYEVSPYYPSAIRFESEIEPAFEKRIYAPLRERILAGANRMRAIQAGSIHAYLAYIFIALVLLLLFGVRE